jgi:SOS-response transcriptional repressor LexA
MKNSRPSFSGSQYFDPSQHEFYDIPLLGEVRLQPAEDSEGDYHISELVYNFRKDSSTSLTVQAMDNGLASKGILQGDFLHVDFHSTLKNGDICALKLGHKVFIRKIFYEKNFIRFETGAPEASPLIIDPQTPGFEIIGKVSTVIREL